MQLNLPNAIETRSRSFAADKPDDRVFCFFSSLLFASLLLLSVSHFFHLFMSAIDSNHEEKRKSEAVEEEKEKKNDITNEMHFKKGGNQWLSPTELEGGVGGGG